MPRLQSALGAPGMSDLGKMGTPWPLVLVRHSLWGQVSVSTPAGSTPRARTFGCCTVEAPGQSFLESCHHVAGSHGHPVLDPSVPSQLPSQPSSLSVHFPSLWGPVAARLWVRAACHGILPECARVPAEGCVWCMCEGLTCICHHGVVKDWLVLVSLCGFPCV